MNIINMTWFRSSGLYLVMVKGRLWNSRAMLLIALLGVLTSLAGRPVQGANTVAVIYNQPPDPAGGFYLSAWWSPDESAYDEYRWDNFTLQDTVEISEIQWVGGYDPAKSGGAGAVLDFKIAIYGSTAMDSQPDVVNPPLVEYQTGGDAGESPAGMINGVNVYDYHFTLPSGFQAQGGTKYWLYIAAAQNGRPDWSFSRGTNGDSIHFRNRHEGNTFQLLPGDFAFTLLGQDQPITGLSVSNDGPTELGQETTFTATISGGTNVTYTWDFGDQTGGSGPVVKHTYSGVGNYVATVTAGNSLGSVQATSEVTIIEQDQPITGLSVSNDSPTELGQVTTFSATISSGTNVTYTWDFGDQTGGSGPVVQHTYLADGNYMATVTAGNSLGSVQATSAVTITTIIEPTFNNYLPVILHGS